MGFRQVSLEFEFDEAGGGLVVSGGNLINVLLNALAQDDVATACRLYEDHGGQLVDQLQAALGEASSTTREAAAKMFAMARDFGAAGRQLELARRFKEAAEMFLHSGDFAAAGRCLERVGDLVRAAAAYDRAGQVELALKLYETGGAREALADCLARNGRAVQAAQVYRQLGSAGSELEALRRVAPEDSGWQAAVARQAEILEMQDRVVDATRVLVEAMRLSAAARGDRDLCSQLIRLFDRQELVAQAQKVRAHLATLGGSTPAVAAPAGAAPATAAAQGGGYEMLKAIPIFAELALPDMKDLYRIAREVSHAAGSVLLESGIEAPGLSVIIDGEVEVLASNDADARVLNTLGPGSYVGEISLIQAARTSARVVAKTAVRALTISRPQFEHYLFGHEAAALRIYRLFSINLAERVRALS